MLFRSMVIKPYTPTISDAFKIKDNPQIENENIQKDSVTYSFFSVPVASTFTPTKGKAQSVVREPLDKIYENFIAVGFGNYTTPYLEAFLHSSSTRSNDFGAFVNTNPLMVVSMIFWLMIIILIRNSHYFTNNLNAIIIGKPT